MRGPVRRGAKVILILPLVVAFLAVVGAAVMLLWNALVPQLFHGPQLGYWQAVGLLALSRVLFGGWRGHGWRGHRHGLRERWEQMTPEERTVLREKMQSRCGLGGSSAEAARAPGP
jgi:hypothetical protein